MGYYTQYSLQMYYIDHSQENDALGPEITGKAVERIIGTLRTLSEEAAYVFDEDGVSGERSKWYEHSEDMKALSLVYPDIILMLHGEGEESGDLWNKYYLKGKEQVAKARLGYDEFDTEKLQ